MVNVIGADIHSRNNQMKLNVLKYFWTLSAVLHFSAGAMCNKTCRFGIHYYLGSLEVGINAKCWAFT